MQEHHLAMTKAFLRSWCNVSAAFPLFTGPVILSKKGVRLIWLVFEKSAFDIFAFCPAGAYKTVNDSHRTLPGTKASLTGLTSFQPSVLLPFLLSLALLLPAGISSSTLVEHLKIIANVSRCASAGPTLTLGWLSSAPPGLSNFSNSCFIFKHLTDPNISTLRILQGNTK